MSSIHCTDVCAGLNFSTMTLRPQWPQSRFCIVMARAFRRMCRRKVQSPSAHGLRQYLFPLNRIAATDCYPLSMDSMGQSGYPMLPATSWAVLGMLTFGEELTGSDLKTWADWSIGFFYWSPSVSQVYSELKKLEAQGFVSYRDVVEEGVRGRRLYAITESGLQAVTAWSRTSPVDEPVLKHGVLLRVWMGHLNDPDSLKTVLEQHIDNMEAKKERAASHAEHSKDEPGWSYSRLSLLWAHRYCQAEIDLARDLVGVVDEVAEQQARSAVDSNGMPRPIKPGRWRNR